MTAGPTPTTPTSFRARWVVPVASPPIENVRVVVDGGRLAAVEKASGPRSGEIDLGDVALLPGLINAHTHLALTHYHGHVPFDGSFTGWIERLVATRRDPAKADREMDALRRGIERSQKAGVAALCDIGYGTDAIEAWRIAPLAIMGCLEVLGMGSKASGPQQAALDDRLEEITRRSSRDAGSADDLAQIGLSPHAPYSTAPEIYRRVVAQARTTGCLVTTHLAETREELQFLREGTGPFRDLLEKWDLWDGSFQPPGCSPVQYAQDLGLLALRPILAHVNYANDADLVLLRNSGTHVALCPRTHAFFQHAPHRYVDMLEAGINVCLGTDSLASNDTLSILDELRFLRVNGSPLSDHQLLELATLHGARALRLDHALGTLEPGKRADMIAIPLQPAATNDPVEAIIQEAAEPGTIIYQGRLSPVPGAGSQDDAHDLA